MDLYDLEQNFGNYYPPKILVELLAFQNKYYDYSKGFGIFGEGTLAIQHLSMNPEFLNRILCFANANNDVTYAIWDDVSGKKIEEMPIVVIDDFKGIHIIAENALQLLELLTYDTAISIYKNKIQFNKVINNHLKSLHHDVFVQWLKENYKIEPTNNPNQIIKTAQDKYKTNFDNWLLNFVKKYHKNYMKTRLIAFIFLCYSVNAQKVIEFNKHRDAINCIVSQNPLSYYVGDGKAATNSKMKMITVAYSGTVGVYDTICTIHKPNKCACQKQIPTFNLSEIFNWEIQEGYMFLRDKENQSIGRIYGLRREDLYQLKSQFDSLRVWWIAYVEKEKKVKQDYIKKRDDLLDPKLNAKKIAAEKAFKETFINKK